MPRPVTRHMRGTERVVSARTTPPRDIVAALPGRLDRLCDRVAIARCAREAPR